MTRFSWRAVIIGIVVLTVATLAYDTFSKPRTPGSPGPARTPIPPYTVEYRVVGEYTMTAFVTYRNASGGTEQMDVKLPWSTSFSSRSGSFVYLSAQNRENAGKITVSIRVNGAQFRSSTSSGAYVIATASGTAP